LKGMPAWQRDLPVSQFSASLSPICHLQQAKVAQGLVISQCS
jgi:hypothetical protein